MRTLHLSGVTSARAQPTVRFDPRGDPGDRRHVFLQTYLAEHIWLQEVIDENGDVGIIGFEHED